MKQFSRIAGFTVLMLALALPALAQKPTIIEIPFTTPFTISGGSANGACTFDVSVAAEEGRPNSAKVIQFANKAIITGPAFLTLTNQSTQKSINLNVSGPSIITFNSGSGIPTTQVLMGPTLLFSFPPNLTAEAGIPAGVSLLNGRTTLTFDAEGNITSVSFNGKSEDVCQALQ